MLKALTRLPRPAVPDRVEKSKFRFAIIPGILKLKSADLVGLTISFLIFNSVGISTEIRFVIGG